MFKYVIVYTYFKIKSTEFQVLYKYSIVMEIEILLLPRSVLYTYKVHLILLLPEFELSRNKR